MNRFPFKTFSILGTLVVSLISGQAQAQTFPHFGACPASANSSNLNGGVYMIYNVVNPEIAGNSSNTRLKLSEDRGVYQQSQTSAFDTYSCTGDPNNGTGVGYIPSPQGGWDCVSTVTIEAFLDRPSTSIPTYLIEVTDNTVKNAIDNLVNLFPTCAAPGVNIPCASGDANIALYHDLYLVEGTGPRGKWNFVSLGQGGHVVKIVGGAVLNDTTTHAGFIRGSFTFTTHYDTTNNSDDPDTRFILVNPQFDQSATPSQAPCLQYSFQAGNLINRFDHIP